MSTLFALYEAHALPVTHPRIRRAWLVKGGTEDYRVEENDRGEWSCQCRDYCFRGCKRRPMGCRHTEFVQELVERGTEGAA